MGKMNEAFTELLCMHLLLITDCIIRFGAFSLQSHSKKKNEMRSLEHVLGQVTTCPLSSVLYAPVSKGKRTG